MPENRNQYAHYDRVPTVNMSRSRFPLSHDVKFSANVGELIPIDCWEVLAGDSFRVQTNKVVRLQTMVAPIMDNMWMDIFWFYAPARILHDHWKNLFGESEKAWYPAVEYSVPTIESAGDHKFAQGSIADYLGIPPETDHLKVNALPFRMYAMICNEWFRDQNLQDPLPVYTGDSMQIASRDRSTLDSYCRGGLPFIAAKKHDVFTSCTPGPIKSATPVLIPGGYVDLQAPVVANATFDGSGKGTAYFYTTRDGARGFPLYRSDDGSIKKGDNSTEQNVKLQPYNLGIDTSSLSQSLGNYHNEVINGTIDQLRMAFQINKLLYRDGLGGSRYRELLRQHFNVIAPDASLQIPQYIGGNRFPIVVHQIANTSEGENSHLGNVGAMSVTTDQHDDFAFSCSEPGYIMCLGVVRYDHTYSQGLHRMWSKQSRYDFYWPELAMIGNQPLYTKEVDCRFGNYTWTDPDSGEVHEGNEVFGYQEAWYDYRYIPDRCSGEMRPGVSNTLASWHLADYYTQQPRFSPEWIQEDKNNVDRCLAVTSQVANQYWADFYFRVDATRPMPVYSVPGLADHM